MNAPGDERHVLPRILLAAPASGSGKTMVTTGILAALSARGLAVSPHKVGPDYIDPGYHAAACGRPGRNLDVHLVGTERIVPLLLHGATTPQPADIAVIEGVMGLFDGALGGAGFASSAHVAALTGTPVVLIVNCASMSRSAGALVHGFAGFDPHVRVAGVVLNNVASPRHAAEVRAAVAVTGIPVIGTIPRTPDVVVPSRHLGLIPAAEREDEATEAVAALARLAGEHLDLDLLMAVARSAGELTGRPWDARGELDAAGAPPAPAHPPVVAIAGGQAFTFGYAEMAELLAAAGARVVTFDPLTGQGVPPGAQALVLPGGFPQVYAATLAANEDMRASVARFAREGGAIAAECAGMLYLAESLDGERMCGVLPVRAGMSSRLAMGYRHAVAACDSVLAGAGNEVTGHIFHRTRIVAADPGLNRAWRLLPAASQGTGHRDAQPGRQAPGDAGQVPAQPGSAGTLDGYVAGNVHASYLHVHPAGAPALAGRLVAAAAGARPW